MTQSIEIGGHVPVENKRFRKYRGDIEIFVAPEEEEQYLDIHGIILRRLDNGATIAGATRSVGDAKKTGIDIQFPSGAYHEPKGKSGIKPLF